MTNAFLRASKGKNDECYTPRYGVEPLLEFLDLFVTEKFAPVEFTAQPTAKELIAALRQKLTIWCPFDDTHSEFVKVFQEEGFHVVYSHIKFGKDFDFYKYEPEHWDILISNPPFTGKADIFKRALSFDKPFALLMTITWLNDGTPAKTFKDKELQILSFDERMQFNNIKGKGKINYLSAYFCYKFLPKGFIFRSFENRNQMRLPI